jgi:hypothetical protein
MQPYGPRSQQRKLIFVAPILVAVERLKEASAPAPKNYSLR